MEFRSIEALPRLRRISELTPEAQGFKAYKVLVQHQETSRVASLAFCPTAPHRLAVVSGTKVCIWKQAKEVREADVTVSKFKDLAQCVAWRDDGKLLLVGEASGSCAVIEPETKSVLRRFMGHGDAVVCAAFSSADRGRAATGGRDGLLRIWDVAAGELLYKISAHEDCLQALAPGSVGADCWMTAGKDGRVRLWDVRLAPGGASSSFSVGAGHGACVAEANHDHPINAGISFPGGRLYVTAGGPSVKIWDLNSGSKIVQSLPDAHSKAITGLALDSDASVLLTASLDGLAKVYSVADLRHLWTYKLPGPASCLAWRPDDMAFAVGLEDGIWQVRKNKSQAAEREATAEKTTAPKRWSKIHGHLRGMDSLPDADDEVVELDRRPKRRKGGQQLDFYFRKFEYRKALEYIVRPDTDKDEGFAALDEMLKQGTLATVLAELPETLCVEVLQWLMKAFKSGDTLQQRLFFETVHTLLQENRCLTPPRTPALLDALVKLEAKVTQELKTLDVLAETTGVLKAVAQL